MYRPLNPNEYTIVSHTVYQERGLSDGLADSLFMAYTARAMALDEAEFVIFQESEFERKARLAEKQQAKVVELQTESEVVVEDYLQASTESSVSGVLDSLALHPEFNFFVAAARRSLLP